MPGPDKDGHSWLAAPSVQTANLSGISVVPIRLRIGWEH
jgi:hypothetical protein